jgi:glutamate synthase domain-containing protein 2/nitrite reductase/ring-hydroxylating ferredoxin subunit
MRAKSLGPWDNFVDRLPAHALVENVTVMYGRCHHRGAMLADGHIDGENLFCGVHGWDYRYKTGISEYHNEEKLHRFSGWIDEGQLWVDEEEISDWEKSNPQPFQRNTYQGDYADVHGTEEEPFVGHIQELAANGLDKVGGHGPGASMGVLRSELPNFDDLQFITAQLASLPQLEDVPCGTELVIGPSAKKPLILKIPIFVSDMSFGALSLEAKTALSKGADLAGTGICSGEGGMLPEEQALNKRYFYELASARFGFSMDKLECVQAFHFKGGQAAKTGTGGHLPGNKVKGRIADVRQLPEGKSAISPSRFPDWDNLSDFRDFAEEVREVTGGIPIGFKLSAQHIEKDIDAALEVGVDYIILDGRGGGTGSAPTIFRDHISVPSLAALPRARKHLDSCGRSDVTLIATGGLRTAADFSKAMALGADGVAVSNAAMQAIGCLGMRACHTNNCPVGIATQKEHLRARLPSDIAALRLQRFFESSVHLMAIMARACGHTHLNQFNADDLTTWKRDVAHLTGVQYAGMTAL